MKKAGIWILILGILLSAVPVFGTAGTDTMSDIAGLDCERAVRELVSLNIMEGYDDGTFRPKAVLNRAEFSALISRVLGMEQGADALREQTVFPGCGAVALGSRLYPCRRRARNHQRIRRRHVRPGG